MALERRPRRRARRAAQVGCLHEEAAAAYHAIGAGRGTVRVLVRRDGVVVTVIPVLPPRENVARHVERAVWRGIALEVAHRLHRVEGLRTYVVREAAVEGITPGIATPVPAARSLLPLGLGRQAIVLA